MSAHCRKRENLCDISRVFLLLLLLPQKELVRCLHLLLKATSLTRPFVRGDKKSLNRCMSQKKGVRSLLPRLCQAYEDNKYAPEMLSNLDLRWPGAGGGSPATCQWSRKPPRSSPFKLDMFFTRSHTHACCFVLCTHSPDTLRSSYMQ